MNLLDDETIPVKDVLRKYPRLIVSLGALVLVSEPSAASTVQYSHDEKLGKSVKFSPPVRYAPPPPPHPPLNFSPKNPCFFTVGWANQRICIRL